MGQFLATGLMTQITLSKSEFGNNEVNIEDLTNQIEKKLGFDFSIFNFTEKDSYYMWELKSEIFAKELIPFLENFLFKMSERVSNSYQVLEELNKIPPEEWFNLAAGKSLENFQLDKYGEREYLTVSVNNKSHNITLDFVGIILALEGKIIMECYGTMFNFFKYCMQQTYKDFKLASALRVYITG